MWRKAGMVGFGQARLGPVLGGVPDAENGYNIAFDFIDQDI